jgi:hypothetical protein
MIGMEIDEIEAYVRRHYELHPPEPLDVETIARLRVLFDVDGRRLQPDPPDNVIHHDCKLIPGAGLNSELECVPTSAIPTPG